MPDDTDNSVDELPAVDDAPPVGVDPDPIAVALANGTAVLVQEDGQEQPRVVRVSSIPPGV